MTNIITIKFGSHLYGTNTPASDVDLKSVRLPTADEILMGRTRRVITENTKADQRLKNSADDIDNEILTLQYFLHLVSEGQTVVLDMLFAPKWSYIGRIQEPWREIIQNRERLVSRNYASFVGYCKTQANKYGIKGSRVAAARSAEELLRRGVETYGTTARVREMTAEIEALVASSEHMELHDRVETSGTIVRYWTVCNKQMPFTLHIKNAHEIMDRIVQNYGHRALAAEKSEGVDWKAISHAVRIAEQAIELLDTGEIIFPRPNAARLLQIKTGQLEYGPIGRELDELLIKVEEAGARSQLPEKVDTVWIDQFVRGHHADVILEEYHAFE